MLTTSPAIQSQPVKPSVLPPREPSAESWPCGWEPLSQVSQDRGAPSLAKGYFLAFKGGLVRHRTSLVVENCLGLVPGDTGAAENEMEHFKAFRRRFSGWPTLEVHPRSGIPRAQTPGLSLVGRWMLMVASVAHRWGLV